MAAESRWGRGRDEQLERCLSLARTMVRGEIDLIEGGHDLVCALRDAGLEHDPDAITVQGFCADTDKFPRHWVRHLWAADALAENDAARERYIEAWRERVVTACRALERMLSAERGRS
jgi:hypothetical protein